jgi:hypothetical protein
VLEQAADDIFCRIVRFDQAVDRDPILFHPVPFVVNDRVGGFGPAGTFVITLFTIDGEGIGRLQVLEVFLFDQHIVTNDLRKVIEGKFLGIQPEKQNQIGEEQENFLHGEN